MPEWLSALAVVSLAAAALCSAAVVTHLLAGNAQKMWVMNLVWPITALYAGPLALAAYFRLGRPTSRKNMDEAHAAGKPMPGMTRPFWQSVALATTHCGSGCVVADVLTEGFLAVAPVTLFGRTLFAGWAIGYALAFLIGIAFQYFTIKPMRRLSAGQALRAAVKADVLSLTAWQVGMYGWMAVVTFALFGRELSRADPVFWFMMQVAMLAGFLTSYPISWWLLRAGVKERM